MDTDLRISLDVETMRVMLLEEVTPGVPRYGRFDRACVVMLFAEIDRLRALNIGLVERVAGQSELLTKRAEGKGNG